MTDSFLENAGGYTPVPDKLVREYGFETAYVWGKVWRYCQMQSGACTASHQTIADRAGMSRRTLIEKLNVLIQDGYIEDKTPNLKNKPHTYCTKIGEIKITSTMQISHTESDNPTETNKGLASESDLSMRTLHSDDADNAQSDSPTMQNLHTEDAEIAQPTMQNLHLKKDFLETLKETQDSSPYGEGDKSPHLENRENLEQGADQVEESPPDSTRRKRTKAPREPADIPEAVKVYRTIAHLYPDKALWPEIAETVGDKPEDLQLWRDVVYGYISSGYHKRNIKQMLGYFRRREIPTTEKQNGVTKNGHYSKPKRTTNPVIPPEADPDLYTRMQQAAIRAAADDSD